MVVEYSTAWVGCFGESGSGLEKNSLLTLHTRYLA